MNAVFDSDILIDHLKGNKEATTLLQECIHAGNTPTCSVLTRIGLLSGMRPGEERQLERFFVCFSIIQVTDEIATTAGMYMNRYRKSHGTNVADAIIAATAKHTGYRLYTRNLKHYPMDDIEVIKPY